MKTAHSFLAITTEGGLLPADFLTELLAPKTVIEGLDPTCYNLAEGERINEQVNRSWNRLKGRWNDFKKVTAGKKAGESTTTDTRDRWLYPVFQELGFGQKLPAGSAIEVDGRSYPVSHGWTHVPIHLVGSHADIDRRTPGAVGAAKASPHSLVQQALNASAAHLWGIVSNGLVFRLLRDSVALTRLSYVEWDLAAIFDGDLYSEFFVFWLVTHQSRFDAERPELCWLEKWKKAAEDKGLRALENLYPGVKTAIAALGAGLVSHAANTVLRDKLRTGNLSTQEFYRQVLRIIYRLLFLFVAEDRGLLHPPDQSETARKAQQRYLDFYSVTRLRALTLYRAGTPHPDLWQVFQFIGSKLGTDVGCPELALPALGSFLWTAMQSTPDLLDCQLSNRHFLEGVHALAFVRDGSVRRSVDYKNLGSEELGSVYQGLLELHPQVNADSGTFVLETASGNERKTTGSFYTPDSLVQCLLESTLEPLIAERLTKAKTSEEKEAILLALKVCDPAVGSGHFILRAGHRVARHLARVRSGEEEASPKVYRTALHDVIGRCLYGVDVNPMSAELCRVSLWLEALEPGKPLSFLDHHIRVGNSLLGTTPELIAAGLPDETFDEIEGDESRLIDGRRRLSAAAELKKLSRRERSGFGTLFAVEDFAIQRTLQAAAAAIEALPDDSPEHIRRKADAFARAEAAVGFRQRKLVADTWCAAFVIPKAFKLGSDEPRGITQRHLSELAQGYPLPQDLAAEAERLSANYGFFHWHLAYPEVFARGGFDLILGNPPWDKIQPEEEKFFSVLRPDITNASSAKVRKALIGALPMDDPHIHRLWAQYKRRIDGTCHYLRSSGVLRYTGDGNLNSYRIFTELAAKLSAPSGLAGLVAQTGLATDESGKELFDYLLSSGRLRRFLDFENRGTFFADVHQQFRFCLITIQGSEAAVKGNAAEFGWLLHSFDELSTPGRLVKLTADDLLLFSPSSRTCPVFTSNKDVGVSRSIYKRGEHVMLNDSQRLGRIDFLGELFNMTRDSGLFLAEPPEDSFSLYEAKFIHQFDHRFADFLNGNVDNLSLVAKRNSHYAIKPKSFLAAKIVRDRLAKRSIGTRWMCGFRDISSATNERTSILAILPLSAVGNSINMVLGLSAVDTACFIANAIVLYSTIVVGRKSAVPMSTSGFSNNFLQFRFAITRNRVAGLTNRAER